MNTNSIISQKKYLTNFKYVKKITNNISNKISVFLFALFVLLALSYAGANKVYAIDNSSSNIGSNARLLSTGKALLSESDSNRNSTGSCDSTCDPLAPTPPINNNLSAMSLVTRLQSCGTGYSGNKTQTRNQLPSGEFTPWVDADKSMCVCAPSFQDTTNMCVSPQAGTYVSRTPWLCSNNVGYNGAVSTISNNCFNPCAVQASEARAGMCPGGFSGYTIEQRDSYCPGGVGSRNTPVWGAWQTVSEVCTPAMGGGPCDGWETRGFTNGGRSGVACDSGDSF